MWLEQLPTVAGTHVDERLIAAFGSRFDVIALRRAEGLDELSAVATCTADELALHLMGPRTHQIPQPTAEVRRVSGPANRVSIRTTTRSARVDAPIESASYGTT